jgi:hypothetical protein
MVQIAADSEPRWSNCGRFANRVGRTSPAIPTAKPLTHWKVSARPFGQRATRAAPRVGQSANPGRLLPATLRRAEMPPDAQPRDAASTERPAAGERDVLRDGGPIGGEGAGEHSHTWRQATSQRTPSLTRRGRWAQTKRYLRRAESSTSPLKSNGDAQRSASCATVSRGDVQTTPRRCVYALPSARSRLWARRGGEPRSRLPRPGISRSRAYARNSASKRDHQSPRSSSGVSRMRLNRIAYATTPITAAASANQTKTIIGTFPTVEHSYLLSSRFCPERNAESASQVCLLTCVYALLMEALGQPRRQSHDRQRGVG